MPKIKLLRNFILALFVYLFLGKIPVNASVIFSDSFSGGYSSAWQVAPGYFSPLPSTHGIGASPDGWSDILLPLNENIVYNVQLDLWININNVNSAFRVYIKNSPLNDWKIVNNWGPNNLLQVSELHNTNYLTLWNHNIGIHHFEINISPLTNTYITVKEDGNEIARFLSFRNFNIGYMGLGLLGEGDYEMSNFVLSTGISEPTPTPTPTSTPTPIPTPTPFPTTGPFELPVNYPGRLTNSPTLFKNSFWSGLTAAFDHVFAPGTFRPFTGNTYRPGACPARTVGISCYDSHNGTDFSRIGGQDVYSVYNGTVAYTSDHDASSCTPNRGGFGCVSIIEFSNGVFGLYAHLDKIFVNTGDSVNASSLIGEMGKTGCPQCGEHLHFGVLKPIGLLSPFLTKTMSRAHWQELLYQIRPQAAPVYRPYCNYVAPNGATFSFQDPSGWAGGGDDPWSLSKADGGCDVDSPYLWKFAIGTTP